MSADIAARLRQLTQDHHDGRLDLVAYRSLRAPLLDSLVTSIVVSTPLEVTQPRAVAATATVRTLTDPKPAKSSARPFGALAMLLAVAVVAVGAFVMLRGRSTGTTAGGPTSAGSQQPGQVLELLGPFMDRGDWSDGRLATLNASLLELGGSQIAAVAHDARFQRFVDELRSRLKEQQALSPTPLTADNSPLAALAVTVGLDLNSPDSALHITALPAAPPSSPAEGVATEPRAPRRVVEDNGVRASGSTQAVAQSTTANNSSGVGTVAPGSGAPGGGTAGAQGSGTNSAGASVSSGANSSSSPGSRVNGTPAAAASAPNAANSARNTAPVVAQASGATSTVESHEGACRLELIRSRRPLCHDVLASGADGPPLALIPAGAFDMGSTASPQEQPVHHVTIRQPFAISVYEVSQGEFNLFCEQTKRPCASQPWSGDDYPVVNVSWDDVRAYTDWLSVATHHHYSLPTEAQWEYAARAGSAGLFPGGADALSATDAQFSGATRQTSAARRSQTFNPNAFRLLHAVGNVREWVEDTWTQSFAGAPDDGSAVNSAQTTSHVVRGGSYADGAARLRLSLRESLPFNTRDVTTGFRIVRELP